MLDPHFLRRTQQYRSLLREAANRHGRSVVAAAVTAVNKVEGDDVMAMWIIRAAVEEFSDDPLCGSENELVQLEGSISKRMRDFIGDLDLRAVA